MLCWQLPRSCQDFWGPAPCLCLDWRTACVNLVGQWLSGGKVEGGVDEEQARKTVARKTGWQVTGKCILLFASGHFVLPLHTHTLPLFLAVFLASLSISLSVSLYIPSSYYPFICLSSGSALNLSSNWWYCTFLELNQLGRSPTSNELLWAGFSSPGILIFKWELNKILFNYSKNNRNKFMYDMSKFWSITPIYNIIYNW